MRRSLAQRRAATVIVAAVALAALTAGAWGLQRWSPFGGDRLVHWPDRIRPLAEFVERTTELRFRGPVAVEFVADDAALARRAGSAEPRSAVQLETDRTNESLGRALGLWGGTTPLTEPDAVFGSPSGAVWLAGEEVLVVVAGTGSTLSPATRLATVGALTQALDQQLFDVNGWFAASDTAQQRQAALATVYGHAYWVRGRYKAADPDSAQPADDVADADADAAWAALPIGYKLLQSAPAIVGPAFIESLMVTDPALIAKAFTSHRPRSIDQVVMPASRYLHDDPLEPVTAPPVPTGASYVAHRQLGHTGLYLLLAADSSPSTALTAADGWGNDAITVYRVDDQLCIDMALVADSPADASRIEAAFERWAVTRPETSHALLARAGTTLYVSSCDPGPDASQRTAAAEAWIHYQRRAEVLRNAVEATRDASLGECMAVNTTTVECKDR